MAMTERSVAVGVFQDQAQAEQAIRELQQAGFSDEQIKYSVHKDGSGILDGLIGLGLSQYEARFYNHEFEAGKTVVVVKTADRIQEASQILRRNRGYDAHTPANERQGDVPQSIGDEHTVQLHEEILQAEKQWVQTGEIRIRKRIITEEKIFRVPVTREEVIIERYPQNTQSDQSAPDQLPQQPVSLPAELSSEGVRTVHLQDGETMKIQVREEKVFIEKKPMVVEEIVLTKRVIQENQHFTDTVRREKVRFERTGNVHIQGDNIEDVPIQAYQQE